MLERLLGAFAKGLVVTTDYSEMGCAEIAVSMIYHSVQRLKSSEQRTASMEFYRAADINEECREVLLSRSSAHKCQHVFGDILKRWPDDTTCQLKACRVRRESVYERDVERLDGAR